ncbi:MAG: thiamine biosynthesis protein [Candidatus Doudnabacteria bacterium RIFCSPHIGHO2_01_FULL_45_18]|uniref:FAD:protein FMN transferase n=1 Tax=Candidatus Doudnabacteria bacterium RIFCSPHIGHO2_01_FULL_45_18 TaxID=1817823 RepID=A0A1F5NQF1_9BACT|nr:MAG: thiamine biosynthesis protein [Candidatus Doudnabacteria bacterium RIFCSPHIGHO2_01_FULL_45_18]
MKQTKILMGMPITVQVEDSVVNAEILDRVFDYFQKIDDRFSTYKPDSEISRINRGEIKPRDSSHEVKIVFSLAELTKEQTGGYFDITTPEGKLDPSGLVKGWAIHNAGKLLEKAGMKDFFIDAGGDIQTCGKARRVGIKNPFKQDEIVKVLEIQNQGMATSGTYIRGQHIYNPYQKDQDISNIRSLTVVGPNVYEADRMATAAFAQGLDGIMFIEKFPGLEGFMIDMQGIGTETSGFSKYVREEIYA